MITTALYPSLFTREPVILSQHCFYASKVIMCLMEREEKYTDIKIRIGSFAVRTLPRYGDILLNDTRFPDHMLFYILGGNENGQCKKADDYVVKHERGLSLNAHCFVEAIRKSDGVCVQCSLAEASWFDKSHEAGGSTFCVYDFPAQFRGSIATFPKSMWQEYGFYFDAAPDDIEQSILSNLEDNLGTERASLLQKWVSMASDYESIEHLNNNLVLTGKSMRDLDAVGSTNIRQLICYF